MASTLQSLRNGAVGFIDWLDASSAKDVPYSSFGCLRSHSPNRLPPRGVKLEHVAVVGIGAVNIALGAFGNAAVVVGSGGF